MNPMKKMILFMHHPSMVVHLWVLVHFGERKVVDSWVQVHFHQPKGQKEAHELYVFATHYLPKCTSVREDYILAFFLFADSMATCRRKWEYSKHGFFGTVNCFHTQFYTKDS
jgi:hypothetical protein